MAEKSAKIERLEKRVRELEAIINSPETDNFISALSKEAEHQRLRYPKEHDGNKTNLDWFWLIGHLATKAVTAKDERGLHHHIITTAAVCANWHRQVKENAKKEAPTCPS